MKGEETVLPGEVCFYRHCFSGAYGLCKGRWPVCRGQMCPEGLGWRLGLGRHQVIEVVGSGQITEERV